MGVHLRLNFKTFNDNVCQEGVTANHSSQSHISFLILLQRHEERHMWLHCWHSNSYWCWLIASISTNYSPPLGLIPVAFGFSCLVFSLVLCPFLSSRIFLIKNRCVWWGIEICLRIEGNIWGIKYFRAELISAPQFLG